MPEPMFSSDPVVIILTIVLLWSFVTACKLRDRLSRRAGKAEQLLQGRAVGSAAVRPSPPLFDQDAR